jgi:hypothetical protein
VRDSVSNVEKGIREFVMRKYRTSSGAGAFKYESRFEARVTHIINCALWPLYLFRFVCFFHLDTLEISFSKSLLLELCI